LIPLHFVRPVTSKVAGSSPVAPAIFNWIGKVIVMAGVPSIMGAILDEVASKLKISVRMPSEFDARIGGEGDIGMQLGEIAKANPGVAIGSYPFFDPQHGRQHECGAARRGCTEARAGQT
jgi:molybdopterin-biosynthesis enzyme MoeA-like protein